jgi:hypothetical protein
MGDLANPFSPVATESDNLAISRVRPKGEFFYIIVSSVLTLLWVAYTAVLQWVIITVKISDPNISQVIVFVVLFFWFVSVLMTTASLVNLLHKRLRLIATLIQIAVFIVLFYTIPIAIWASIQLFYSWKYNSRLRLASRNRDIKQPIG